MRKITVKSPLKLEKNCRKHLLNWFNAPEQQLKQQLKIER